MSDMIWEQKRLCFEMLQRWSSDGHRRSRAVAWDTLTEMASSTDGPIDLTVLKENDPEKYHSVFTVLHFFIDLHTLVKEGVLQRHVAKLLFEYHYAGWKSLIGRLSYSSTETEDWVQRGLGGLDHTLANAL